VRERERERERCIKIKKMKNILRDKVNAVRILKLEDKIRSSSDEDHTVYANVAILLLERARYDKAIEYLIQGSRLYPTDSVAQAVFQRLLGSAYYRRWIKTNRDIKRAHAHFEHCMKFPENTTNPSVLYEFAETYRAQGAFEGAIKIYSHIIEHFPGFSNLRRVIMSAATTLSHMGYVTYILPLQYRNTHMMTNNIHTDYTNKR